MSLLAQAYYLNITAAPRGKLGYIAAYATGGSMLLASTLNVINGQVTANAELAPAGTTDLVRHFRSFGIVFPGGHTAPFTVAAQLTAL